MVASKTVVEIMTAAERDFPDILLLVKQLWPNDRFNEQKIKKVFIRSLKNRNQKFLIAKVDGDIAGFAEIQIANSLRRQGYSSQLGELVVHEKYRGKGVGKKLLEESIKFAKSRSCKAMSLSSANFRKIAHGLYLKHGFEKRDSTLFLKRF